MTHRQGSWSGNLPPHWRTLRLKWTIRDLRNGTWGADPDGENDIPCVRVADFDRERLRVSDTVPTLRAVDPSERSGRILRRGDLLIEKSGGGELQPVGTVVIYDADVPAVCSNFIARLTTAPGYESRYLKYLHAALYATRVTLRSIKQTTGIQNLDSYSYFCEQVPSPPIEEQRTIADFLDREVQKIDALIGSQRHLIRLIEEQRLSLICRAVTQGLDPSARRKPSGIPWLDAVPDHWTVLAAKRVSRVFVPQRNKPDLNSTGVGIPWITMEQIGGEQTKLPRQWVSDEAASNAGSRVLGPGAVIASCVGTFGVTSINTESVIINQQLQAFIPSHRVSATFLRLCVIGARNYFEQVATEATLTYVNQERFGNMPLPLPPVHEQEQIAVYVTGASTLFNTAINSASKTIELLNEYRVSLISAAVTGQINVSTYRPQEAAVLCQ